VSNSLLKEQASDAQVIRCLTAFTHPRRLTVLRCLQRCCPLPFSALANRSGISPTALLRHLTKLAERELITEGAQGWSLTPTRPALADTFLSLLARSPEA
jgi:DNA-binding IclR family transcriptional regulator